MTAKQVFIRHVQSSEIRKVSADERDTYDPNFWVEVTGNVKETAAGDVPTGANAEPATQTTSAKK